ncbi:MAG: hypothetical protein EKK47_08330 [Burkholderiales bacterium]|jgi:hypothetical protein|nr:MAG: hypothetical protein EKK47_08330 [Burkholderiales bacterium]
MIHHLARAFFVRSAAAQNPNPTGKPPSDGTRPADTPAARPVKARPITPWSVPSRPSGQSPGNQAAHKAAAVIPLRAASLGSATSSAARRVRISTDPADARRTVIAGRFAEVCAALDRLVMEQEATTA